MCLCCSYKFLVYYYLDMIKCLCVRGELGRGGAVCVCVCVFLGCFSLVSMSMIGALP
uniref:Uncharacterized protein n=1 Tax=Arundo donax TaxID=35708 RepID=A0A0A9DMQ8_ARUDO